MKVIAPFATILASTPDLELVIEQAGRVCYKSEDRIRPGSAEKFIEHLKGLHHESVLEHGSITVSFVCDRGISHELVRHRIASFSQESTRYCNYAKDKFGEEITFIDIRGAFPDLMFEDGNYEHDRYEIWHSAMARAEEHYLLAIKCGATAQEARAILPNSLKTEVVVTANPREWRHIFTMRTSRAAHPQMREIMIPLLHEFQSKWPVLFNDIKELA